MGWPQGFDWAEMLTVVPIEEALATTKRTETETLCLTAQRQIVSWGGIVTVLLLLVWPLLSLPARVFSQSYFGFYLGLVAAIAIGAAIIMLGLPILETWEWWNEFFRNLFACRIPHSDYGASHYASGMASLGNGEMHSYETATNASKTGSINSYVSNPQNVGSRQGSVYLASHGSRNGPKHSTHRNMRITELGKGVVYEGTARGGGTVVAHHPREAPPLT